MSLLPKSPKAPSEAVRGLLKALGLRVTDARLQVIEALQAAKRPLGHDELLTVLDPDTADRATVYRNLVALSRAGLLHRHLGADRIWRYGWANALKQDEGHPHFSCTSCGTTECLDQVDVSLHGRARAMAEHSASIEVFVRGECGPCREGKHAGP